MTEHTSLMRCSIYNTEGARCPRATDDDDYLCPEHRSELDTAMFPSDFDAYTDYLRQKRDAEKDSGV
jgi:hypothetical protein